MDTDSPNDTPAAALRAQFEDSGIIVDSLGVASALIKKTGLFYCPNDGGGRFHFRQPHGAYTSVPWSGFAAAISACGIDWTVFGDNLSQALPALRAAVIRDHSIDTICNLAGHPAGLAVMRDGKRVLVPTGMKMMDPREGDPSPMINFVRNLCGGEGRPYDTLMSWLKVFVVDGLACSKVGVVKANVRQSQLLVIVGPPGCGKSLLIQLVGNIFGSTKADPYSYFCSETDFNSDMTEAVMLVMDDVAESVRPLARNRLTQRIKQYLVNPDRRNHPKGMKATSVQTFQRVVMLTNEDAISVLPAIESSFMDKVVLLRAHESADVSAYREPEERAAWYGALDAAVPAFLHYLLSGFVIPAELRNGRYGSVSYQDPALLAELHGEDNYSELLRCIGEHYLFEKAKVPAGKYLEEGAPEDPDFETHAWEGYARQFQELVAILPQTQGWSSLFPYSNSAGMVLQRMSQVLPKDVKRLATIRGSTRWRVVLAHRVATSSTKQTDATVPKLPSRVERQRTLDEDE